MRHTEVAETPSKTADDILPRGGEEVGAERIIGTACGFIAFSGLGIIQIIVLVVAILPSLLLAKKAIEYLRG